MAAPFAVAAIAHELVPVLLAITVDLGPLGQLLGGEGTRVERGERRLLRVAFRLSGEQRASGSDECRVVCDAFGGGGEQRAAVAAHLGLASCHVFGCRFGRGQSLLDARHRAGEVASCVRRLHGVLEVRSDFAIEGARGQCVLARKERVRELAQCHWDGVVLGLAHVAPRVEAHYRGFGITRIECIVEVRRQAACELWIHVIHGVLSDLRKEDGASAGRILVPILAIGLALDAFQYELAELEIEILERARLASEFQLLQVGEFIREVFDHCEAVGAHDSRRDQMWVTRWIIICDVARGWDACVIRRAVRLDHQVCLDHPCMSR